MLDRVSETAMIYFYRRAGITRSCEARLDPEGPGFELVVSDGQDARIERFDDATALADREHELRHAWLLNGWRTIGPDGELDQDD